MKWNVECRTVEGRSKSYVWWLAGMMWLFSSAFLLQACHSEGDGHDHGHEEAEAEKHDDHEGLIVFEPEQARAAGLQVEVMKRAPFHAVIPASGSILPAVGEEKTVAATAAGIVRLPAGITEGQTVRAGQTLAWVSARNMEDGDPVEKARIAYEYAQKELQRAEALAGDRIVSDKELRQVRLQAETARTAYVGMMDRVGRDGVGMTSPLSGYVKQMLVRPGDYVTAGQPLFVVTQTKRLQLRAEVAERYFSRLAGVRSACFRTASDDAVVCIDSLGGKLLAVGRSVAQGNFYVPVTFAFNNVGRFVPGSYAEIWLTCEERPAVLTIPQTALSEEQGIYYAYVQVGEDHYRKAEVKPGESDGNRVEILQGLKEGDRVVTRGVTQVRLAANSGVIPEGHNHNH